VEEALQALSEATRRYTSGAWVPTPEEQEISVRLWRIVGAGRPTLQQWLDGAEPVPDPDLADLVDAIAEVLPAHGPLADMGRAVLAAVDQAGERDRQVLTERLDGLLTALVQEDPTY
jgi:hypothetical protein